MKSLRFLDRRAGFSLGAIGLLLGMVAPAVLPALTSAAQLTSRSIQLSNSTADASGVSYKITFTPSVAYKGIVIDWCDDSPILSSTCHAPGGFDAGSTPAYTFTANGPSGTMNTTNSSANHTAIGGTVASASATNPVTLEITGVHNQTAEAPFYARIYTYNLATPDWTAADTPGTVEDSGGVAMATTQTIGVSAVVKETMTFCVSKDAPGPTCGVSGQAVTTPNLTLGHGSPLALDATAVDTATAYAQLSTNAVSGAIVNMTNNNSCGGLHRGGDAGGTCGIPAAGAGANTTGGFTIPTAAGSGLGGFGLSVGSASGTGTNFGTIAASAPYNGGANKYGMYTTGVTGTYGDTIFSATGPLANQNVPLTFGAAAANNSPAGTYTANMNLVATGTY